MIRDDLDARGTLGDLCAAKDELTARQLQEQIERTLFRMPNVGSPLIILDHAFLNAAVGRAIYVDREKREALIKFFPTAKEADQWADDAAKIREGK